MAMTSLALILRKLRTACVCVCVCVCWCGVGDIDNCVLHLSRRVRIGSKLFQHT